MEQENEKQTGLNEKTSQLAEEFPGYPLYAPEEDIMNKAERVDVDLEAPTSNSKPLTPVPTGDEFPLEETETENLDESEVTPEDLAALGPKDISMDDGDDQLLEHRTTPVDFAGEDLDIPGVELDDAKEAVGSEDEENNSYSLGGDNHQDLEESRP